MQFYKTFLSLTKYFYIFKSIFSGTYNREYKKYNRSVFNKIFPEIVSLDSSSSSFNIKFVDCRVFNGVYYTSINIDNQVYHLLMDLSFFSPEVQMCIYEFVKQNIASLFSSDTLLSVNRFSKDLMIDLNKYLLNEYGDFFNIPFFLSRYNIFNKTLYYCNYGVKSCIVIKNNSIEVLGVREALSPSIKFIESDDLNLSLSSCEVILLCNYHAVLTLSFSKYQISFYPSVNSNVNVFSLSANSIKSLLSKISEISSNKLLKISLFSIELNKISISSPSLNSTLSNSYINTTAANNSSGVNGIKEICKSSYIKRNSSILIGKMFADINNDSSLNSDSKPNSSLVKKSDVIMKNLSVKDKELASSSFNSINSRMDGLASMLSN